MTQSTLDLVRYYQNLLILQYIGKSRAYATIGTQVAPVIMPQVSVQTIAFSPVPTAGQFVLSYDGGASLPINWDDSAATVQTKLRGIGPVLDGGDAATTIFDDTIDGGDALTTAWSFEVDGGDAYGYGLSAVIVTGSIASGLLTVTFVGVDPPADLLELDSSTLLASGDPVTVTITETDETLPLAVQNGFNLTGSNIAAGAQLDVIGKYAGVARSGNGFTAPVTLGDDDFLSLIRMAIIKNSSGSSLATIQDLLFRFFPGTVTVVDYKNMTMAYYISSAVASEGLIELFVTESVLPVPMAVGFVVITFDALNAFGFEGSVNSGGFGDLSDPAVGGMFASIFYP